MHDQKTIAIVVLLLASIAAASIFDVYSFTQYSCLECRATLTKRRICGVPIQRVSYDAYSTEVLARDPSHQHQWRWCGSIHSDSLVSDTFSCGRQHPIWQLPISVHAKYAQLVPPAELHQALQAIESADRKTGQAAVKRVWEQVLNSP
jgi:hypothetical protein